MDNQINNLLKSTKNAEQLACAPEQEEIFFKSNGVLTLGVEIELQLIDSENYNLCSRATDVLSATAHLEKIKPEFYLSTIEVNTDKCITTQEVEKDLYTTLAALQGATKNLGVLFSTTGSHPFSKYSDWEVSPTTRY
ncbi:glutamate-cysteine ligase family protein, partial [Legionella parisiensis]